MPASQDPLGCYAVLGVEPSASLEQIKKAYKEKAQQIHPDRNCAEDATRQFQILNDAYCILGDPGSRSDYDASVEAAAGHPDDLTRTQPSVPPIKCCVCGRISLQPRYVIYRQTISFVIATHRGIRQGVFCARCGAAQAYKDSFITWTLGWWGLPWGPIYSIQAIVRNMVGGEQPPVSNLRILAAQAAHFASANRMDLARALADQAIAFARRVPPHDRFQESSEHGNLLALLTSIQAATRPTTRPMKPSWGIGSLAFKVQGMAAAAVTLTVFVLLISSANFLSASSSSAAQNNTPQPIVSFNEPPRPLPATGQVHAPAAPLQNALAPLQISTFPGSPNYYLKLIDFETHIPVMIFFIRSGEALSTVVPLGRYQLRFASGFTWSGEAHLFGPDTSYNKVESALIFEREGNAVAGYKLYLNQQSAGDFKESRITPSDF